MPLPNVQIPANASPQEIKQAAAQAEEHLAANVYEPIFAKVAIDRGLPCSNREELEDLMNIAVMLKQANANQRSGVIKAASDQLAKKLGIQRTPKAAAAAAQPSQPQVPQEFLASVVKAAAARQDIVNAVTLYAMGGSQG